MKIENGYSRQLQNIRQAKEQSSSRKQATNEATEREAGVSVEISQEAQALLEADKAKHDARVEEIKAQISEGTYHVDPQTISNGLLSAIQSQKEQ
jgi:flagellar biosynthesis anti-sigma factor FlgM